MALSGSGSGGRGALSRNAGNSSAGSSSRGTPGLLRAACSRNPARVCGSANSTSQRRPFVVTCQNRTDSPSRSRSQSRRRVSGKSAQQEGTSAARACTIAGEHNACSSAVQAATARSRAEGRGWVAGRLSGAATGLVGPSFAASRGRAGGLANRPARASASKCSKLSISPALPPRPVQERTAP